MSWFKYGSNSLSPQLRGLKSLIVCIFEDEGRGEVEKEIARGDFDRLVISAGEIHDLRFLAKCLPGGPTRLLIQGGVSSLDGLDALSNLADFECDVTVQGPYPHLNQLPLLKRCWLAWDRRYDSQWREHGLFLSSNLEELTLRNWSRRDCDEIGKLTKLKLLDLRQGPLISVQGLEGCTNLTAISLGFLPKLADIAAVPASVNTLHIENCGVSDLSPIFGLRRLVDLHVEKIHGQFKSTDWLGAMTSIKKLRLACPTEIIDWSALFNHPSLEDVALQTHKGFKASDAEILAAAEGATRKVVNFQRIGTKAVHAFSFELQ